MRVRKTTHLALTLLVAAGLGVCLASAEARNGAVKKSTTTKSVSTTHRKRLTRKSARRERGQKAPTTERISEIQVALAKDGSFDGKPNGKWDSSTIEATRKFQQGHGLNPTGKLDAKTLQRLGLGSETAGVAPPMPPISSSSMQKTPTAESARRQP